MVVWIIFLRLAGPFPIHASTSFRGVSLSSMDAASSTICTTCLACWVMSTVVKSGSGRSQRITNSNLDKMDFHSHKEYLADTCNHENISHTPFAWRQVSHIWLHPSSSHTSSKLIAMREHRHLHTANMRVKSCCTHYYLSHCVKY